MRRVGCLIYILSSVVFADGSGTAGTRPTWQRMPNVCEVNRMAFGDPVVVSGARPFSAAWDDDVRFSSPGGEFVLTRIHVGDSAALGQTVPDSSDPACRESLTHPCAT